MPRKCVSPRKSHLRTRPSSPCHAQPVPRRWTAGMPWRMCSHCCRQTAGEKAPRLLSTRPRSEQPLEFPAAARLCQALLANPPAPALPPGGENCLVQAESSEAGRQSLALSHRFKSVVEAVTNARRFPVPCFSHQANPIFVTKTN